MKPLSSLAVVSGMTWLGLVGGYRSLHRLSCAPSPACPVNDTLNGTPGHDTICGLGGDDVIRGHSGQDYVQGGTGTITCWATLVATS